MTHVVPFENETIESLIKRFSKKVTTSGIIQEVRARQSYVKPSDAARKEKAAAQARIQRQKRKMDRIIAHQNEFKFRPKYNRNRPPRQEQPLQENKQNTQNNGPLYSTANTSNNTNK